MPHVSDDRYSTFELLRGLVSALSNRGDLAVSIVALQHELRRRAASDDIVAPLYQLSEVRDLQHVGRGFWLPAPSHKVPFDGFSLLVSGLPNQELGRLFGCAVEASGASRWLRDESSVDPRIPSSPAHEWIGAPKATVDWTRELLAAAQFLDAQGLEGAEVFRATRGVSAARWTVLNPRHFPGADIRLIRFQSRNTQASYYLLRVSSGRVTGMSEITLQRHEVRRLQFGLRAIHKDPAVFWFESTPSQEWSVLDSPPLPNAERRLMVGLGNVDEQIKPGRWRVRIPSFSERAVSNCLRALGLSTRMDNQ